MTNEDMNEERLRNTTAPDREAREMTDRPITENRELSDDERIEMFRMASFQHVLPDIPKIPGYHVCWISTTSQNDTLHRRIRLGYEFITRADMPGWDFDMNSLKTGEHAGKIGINEMVAMKLKDNLYQAYMKEAHHDAPAREDEKLIQNVEGMKTQAKQTKTYVETFDGQDEVEESSKRKTPRFE